jgi:acyl-coenzyme A synthetase/AMP-(fatty) acid ligase
MTIRDLFESKASKYAERIAQKWYEDKTWRVRNWAEMKRGVYEVAEGYGRRFALKAQEDNAAIILQNSPIWIESYLAQAGTGVSVVPIDPKLHNDEVSYILKDAQVKVVTTDKAHLMMMMKIAKDLPCLKAVVINVNILCQLLLVNVRKVVRCLSAYRFSSFYHIPTSLFYIYHFRLFTDFFKFIQATNPFIRETNCKQIEKSTSVGIKTLDILSKIV